MNHAVLSSVLVKYLPFTPASLIVAYLDGQKYLTPPKLDQQNGIHCTSIPQIAFTSDRKYQDNQFIGVITILFLRLAVSLDPRHNPELRLPR